MQTFCLPSLTSSVYPLFGVGTTFTTCAVLASVAYKKTHKHHISVVTVSKCFLSVGFGRFCRKRPRFSVWFRFSW